MARLALEKDCCERAELAGLLRMGASLMLSAGRKLALSFTTENAAVARRTLVLLKQRGTVRTEVMVRRSRRLSKTNTYFIRVLPGKMVDAMISEMGLPFESQSKEEKNVLLRKKCCRVSYLRGAFLAGGSINRPEASCHLEYVTTNYQFAELLHSLLRRLGFPVGITGRKEEYIVYLKEGDAILDFLSMLGAEEAATAFEAARNIKEVRNQVNRLVNCETANLGKTANAAARQVAALRSLESEGRLAQLTPGLRAAAEARLAYPEASLSELGVQLGIGRSGVNHRLRRLMELAAEREVRRAEG